MATQLSTAQISQAVQECKSRLDKLKTTLFKQNEVEQRYANELAALTPEEYDPDRVVSEHEKEMLAKQSKVTTDIDATTAEIARQQQVLSSFKIMTNVPPPPPSASASINIKLPAAKDFIQFVEGETDVHEYIDGNKTTLMCNSVHK
jgi:hypothetical protein